uniref:Carbohydrate sulfotransferase 5-like n=1 Tax=Hirondellea gigas TaxID=1518452 RepID=A0A6A7G6P6_9CRUS
MTVLVKCVLGVSVVVVLTMLMYDHQIRGYEFRSSVNKSFSTKNLTKVLLTVNADLAAISDNTDAELQNRTLQEIKNKLVANLTIADLEKLVEMVQRNETLSAPNPQSGIGRPSTTSHKRVSTTLISAALEKLKLFLLEEVTGTRFPELMNKAMEAYPGTNNGHPKTTKIVIVTTWRSGSTFLEELLSSHPAVFDIYEPLLMYDLKRIREGPVALEAQGIVSNLLKCKYQEDSYMAIIKRIKNMMERNRDLHRQCKSPEYGLDICYDLKFLSTACKLFPWTLMKLVRMKLELMQPMLESSTLSDGLQIIYLVRDPRAVINSRRSTVHWCKSSTKDCASPSLLCQDMIDDIKTFKLFQEVFPGKVHLLRYEDMANDPFNKTKQMLDAIGLDFNARIEEFLLTHTKTEVNNAWTTSRNTKKRLLYWTHKLPWSDVQEVQAACSSAMESYGYIPVQSLDKLTLNDVLRPLAGSI